MWILYESSRHMSHLLLTVLIFVTEIAQKGGSKAGSAESHKIQKAELGPLTGCVLLDQFFLRIFPKIIPGLGNKPLSP